MAFSAAIAVAWLAQRWAPVLSTLADPALLLDCDDGLIACTAAARALLGGAVDVPGTRAQTLLGLAPEAHLSGQMRLVPLAIGVELQAELRQVELFDESGTLAGTLLLISAAPLVRTHTTEGVEDRLREVALTISSTLGSREVLERVVDLSIELLGANAGALALLDTERARLVPSYALGVPPSLRDNPLYRGNGAVWHLIDTGKAFLHNNYPSDPRALQALVEQGVCAVVGAPVIAGNQILGVIVLYRFGAERPFSQQDLELVEIIGRQAGVALQNAQRYEAALRESHRRQMLYSASVAFGAALAPEKLYLTIHRTLVEIMPCDMIAIALYEATTAEIQYVYVADEHGRCPEIRTPVERGLIEFIIRSGVSIRVSGCNDEIAALFGAEPFSLEDKVPGSLMALNLSIGSQTIGALTVQSVLPDAYSADDLTVLETLVVTLAIALQNAHLFARVNEIALIDPLTSVYNRRHFFAQAADELKRAGQEGYAISLIMLDADYFKQINDRYGHMVGDQVLQMIAKRCADALRGSDMIGRYGGEEFLVLLPQSDAPQALIVAERLLSLISSEPVQTEAGPVAVSISVGVASYPAGSIGSFEELLDQVDKALYNAKAAGRNQVQFL